jgi:hypothetical protein
MQTHPAGRHRLVRLLCAAALSAALAGCATIPREQFTEYVGAFEQARDAGLQIYDEITPALREGGSGAAEAAAFAASLGPAGYSRSPCAARYPDLPSVQARCDLLHAITGYHEVLTALNQGTAAAAVKARLGEVAASLGSLSALAAIPAAGSVIAPVATLIGPLSGLVETALALGERAELRNKLEQGAPSIHAAIAALEQDVARIHEVQRAAYALRLRAVEAEILELINPALRTAGTRDRSPGASARIVRGALDERFEALFALPEPKVGARLADLPAQANGQVISDDELAGIADALDAVAPQVARFHDIAGEWHTFLDALHAYDDLLTSVDQSLVALLAASSNPFALGGGTLQQLDGAIGAVRRDARRIREILSAL